MTDHENLHFVKAGFGEVNELCDRYPECYTAHYKVLPSGHERDAESHWFEVKDPSIIGFNTQAQGWIQQTERHLSDQFDGISV